MKCYWVLFAVFSLSIAMVAKADTNVALSPSAGGTNAGVAIFGVNTGADISTLGFAQDHSGTSAYLNDGVVNGSNGDDTWGYGNGYDGYVGATFTLTPGTDVKSIVFYGRLFGDGGWYGYDGTAAAGPGGNSITAANLIAPTVQYTTNGGMTWITDAAVSNDYVTQLTGAAIGGGAATNPATFTFTTPLTSVDGVRLIGEMGGTAGGAPGGFLGADEIEVFAGAVPEPSTWALMLGGVAMLAVVIRRRAVRV